MFSYSSILRHFSAGLMVRSYTMDQIHGVFHALAAFIGSASEDYFEEPDQQNKKSFKEIPLYLTDRGVAALKEHLSQYPDVLKSGKIEHEPAFKGRKPNFLYLVGQFLTAVASRIAIKEIQLKDDFKKHEKDVKALYDLWGSENNMNPLHLFEEFETENNKTARTKLSKRLFESAAIMDKLRDLAC